MVAVWHFDIISLFVCLFVCSVSILVWDIRRLNLLHTVFTVIHALDVIRSNVHLKGSFKCIARNTFYALLKSLISVTIRVYKHVLGHDHCPSSDLELDLDLEDDGVFAEGCVITTAICHFPADIELSLSIFCCAFNRRSPTSPETRLMTLSWPHFLAARRWRARSLAWHFIRA